MHIAGEGLKRPQHRDHPWSIVLKRENIVDMVMEMKFSITIHSQVFYGVGPSYRRLPKFIIVDQYVGFPGEGYNFRFRDPEFHTVSSAPTLCRVYVRLN
jgi:hypothetical protein